jgi:hypothetical protein
MSRWAWVIMAFVIPLSCQSGPRPAGKSVDTVHQNEISKASDVEMLSYEPTVVRLEGCLASVLKYGPPNYGEDTTHDQKIHVPILVLSRPINVRGDSSNALNADSFTNLTQVQLTFPASAGSPARLFKQHVIVTGTLAEAESGHHFTEVWMSVKSIQLAPRN